MIFHVVSFPDGHAGMRYLLDCGFLLRSWAPVWTNQTRDKVAFVSKGRVLAIADWGEVKPSVHPKCTGYWWHFDNIQRIEEITEQAIECGPYGSDVVAIEAGPIPMMLNAHAQWLLEKLLIPEVPLELPEEPTPALATNDSPQLSLF